MPLINAWSITRSWQAMALSPPHIYFTGKVDNYSGKILMGIGVIIDTIAKPGG